MTPRLVAIHQPNFLPWLGYFDKIARADVFVFLDHVQFPKKGGTWANRVKMLTGGDQASWVTVPVDRSYHGLRTIAEMETDESRPWREQALKTIANSYRRSPSFDEIYPVLTELIENPTSRLAQYNQRTVRELTERLGLQAEFALSSELDVSGEATELLVEIVRAVEGTAYLAGGGAEGYQDDSRFEEAGIEPLRQEFDHPGYPQLSSEPIAGLSIVDPLMSLGFAGTRELLGAR